MRSNVDPHKGLCSEPYLIGFAQTRRSDVGAMDKAVPPKYGALKSTPQPKDKLQQVQNQTDELKEIMIDNIDKAIRRGEEIERMDQKASELEIHARTFEKRATALKWSQRCLYYKWWCLAFLIVAIVLVLILWASGAFNN